MTDATQNLEGRPVSRQFAKAMLATFNMGLRFMNSEHIELRHQQLNECIETGWMVNDLKAVFNWTQKKNPRISP